MGEESSRIAQRGRLPDSVPQGSGRPEVEYLMETIARVPSFKRGISKETRAWVLERNGYTCQMCGAAAGDPDPIGGNRTVRLTMGHILDKSKGGDDTPNNLRAVCTGCNEGLQNSGLPKPDTVYLLSQIRRATIDGQLAVLEWLTRKFKRASPDQTGD